MGIVLDILLLILKIIGFTLLGILGLILLILMIILFVPIRYKADLAYEDEFTLHAKATWLLHLLKISVDMKGKEPEISARLAFKDLMGDKEKKAKRKKEKSRPETVNDSESMPINIVSGKTEERAEIQIQSNNEKSAGPEHKMTEVEGSLADEKKGEEEELDLLDLKDEEEEIEKPSKPDERGNNKPLKSENMKESDDKSQKTSEAFEDKEEEGESKLKKLRDLKDKAFVYIEDPRNQNAVKLVWNSLKRLLKSILPRRIEGFVEFGFDDPATTGKILAAAAFFYSKHGNRLKLYPNFQDKEIKAKLKLKGHIRFFTIVIIGIKVYFNKDVKYVINEIKEFKSKD